MQNQKLQNRIRLVGSTATLVIAVTILLLVVFFRQPIIDQYYISQYQPTSDEIALRDTLQMTPRGEYLYNASHVDIQPAKNFNSSCQQEVDTSNPILGCYTQQRIYVFEIENQKLAGIVETTAAHELLHAAYERMSDDEKNMINAELQRVYETVKTPELEERMKYYDRTQPGERLNELHSILGTEYLNLGSILETHYLQYFKDRSYIVGFYNNYSSVFMAVLAELKRLESAINTASAELNQTIESYNQSVEALESDFNTFNSKNRNGGFTSLDEFDRERSVLLARQSAINSERANINAEIARINELRDRYNMLAKEYNELNQSINSSLAPTPSLE